MEKITYTIALLCFALQSFAQEFRFQTKFDDAIPVLNLGTFHMGYTPDANKVEFDEYDKENVAQIHEIAKALAAFKPTVIVVETTANYQPTLEKLYKAYLQNPAMTFEKPNEVELLAYEIGRLSGAERIYGINYKEEYNYGLYWSLPNKVDSTIFPKYEKLFKKNEAIYVEKFGEPKTVLDLLVQTNHPDYLDFLINVNADMLTYVSSKGKAEGADEAAKFYHRNLVMFSNLNQIQLTKDDRVFILMGATHTAYFNEFMKRSPKYKVVDVFDYLK
ncbi:DUF5694 domain-containing protein [Sphingobacterium hungaricum]|uniref:DUF5694 domain-containing protein n=1 Tax=Sphingobacterium hungaricum TaxID=2082723 RepID=UPI0018C98B1E|nr:DUF5694 domain-containing protein [Sphingobacterium hungaricum]